MNLLDMDIRTIVSLLFMGNLAQLIILFFYRNIPECRRPYWHYTAGKMLESAAWLLLGMRGKISVLFSAYVGNVLLLAGLALVAFSLTTVGREEKKWGRIYGSIAGVGIAAFCIFASTPNHWVGYSSLAAASLFLTAAAAMLFSSNSSSLRMIVGLFFGLNGMILIFRAWNGFFADAEFSLMSRNIVQTLTFSTAFLLLIVSGIGFLLLFKEQADRLIDESEKKYRTLVEKASEFICIIQEGAFVFVNGKERKLFGFSEHDLIGRRFADFVFEDDRDMAASYYKGRGEDANVPETYNLRAVNREGRPVWVQISATLIEYGGKRATLVLAANIDDLKQSEKALRESEEKFRLAFDNANTGVCLVDLEGNLTRVNDKMTAIFGYSRGELEGMTVNDLAVSEDIDLSPQFISRAIWGSGDSAVFEKRYRHRQGHIIHCLVASSLVHDAQKNPLYFISQIQDITERKRLESALRSERENLDAIFASSPVGMLVLDKELSIVKANMAATAIAPGSNRELLLQKPGRALGCVRSAEDPRGCGFSPACPLCPLRSAITSVIDTGKSLYGVETEMELIRNGKKEHVWLNVGIEPLTIHGEREIIVAVNDITDRKRMEAELKDSERRYRELSIIDGLTQLYNSRHFYRKLAMEIDRVNRYAEPMSLILLDVDNFKSFNDTYGHVEGDQVLVRLGQVIKRCLRKTDSAYRYGGEEFVILLPMTKSIDGAVIAERIRTEFKREAFSPVTGKDEHMTVSIGLAQYEPHEDMKDFISRVDRFMYRAKKEGKDRVASESGGGGPPIMPKAIVGDTNLLIKSSGKDKMRKSQRKGESVMEQEKKTCPFCGKQVDILYACSGCNVTVCVACHHLELAGSGCGTVIPLYYCPKCVADANVNPNACFKDEW